MPYSSNIPQLQVASTGVIVPDTPSVLTGALADLDAAFGGGMSQNLETPQGQIATSIAAVVSDKNSQVLEFSNQIDPATASGVYQDAIGKLYFLTRYAALPTVVQCTISGVAGTVIPAGTLATDTSGNSYIASGSCTIGAGGTVSGQFENLVTGAIACPAGTLTKVGQAIGGWDAITNAADGVIGRDVESRLDFEFRRKNSVAGNANGMLEAIRGAVIACDGVLDCYVTENSTAASTAFGATSYSLLPNSIYVAASGGSSADIANAILSKRAGCGDYNGNTSVTIQDAVNYVPPYPSYVVKFNRPTATPIKFLVQILANANLPVDIETSTKNAIIAAFNGTDGGQRARIGATLSTGRYYGGVSAISPYVAVAEILLGISSPVLTNVTLGIDQIPTITSANITVQII